MSEETLRDKFNGDPNFHRRMTRTVKVGRSIQQVEVQRPSDEQDAEMILAGVENIPLGGQATGFARFVAMQGGASSPAPVAQGGSTGFAAFAAGKDLEEGAVPAGSSKGFGLSEGVDPTQSPERRREPANDGGNAIMGADRELYPHEPEELNRNEFGKGESGSSPVSTASTVHEEIIEKPLPTQRRRDQGSSLDDQKINVAAALLGLDPDQLRAVMGGRRTADDAMPNMQSEVVDTTDVRDRSMSQEHETVDDPADRGLPGNESEKPFAVPEHPFAEDGSPGTPGFSQSYPDQPIKDTEIQASLKRISLLDGRVIVGRVISRDALYANVVGRVAGSRSDASFSIPVSEIKSMGPLHQQASERKPEGLSGAYSAFKKSGARRPLVRETPTRVAGVVGKLQAVPGGAPMFVMDDNEGSGDYSYTYDISQAKELNPQEQQEFLTYHENGELIPKTASRIADKIPGGLAEGKPDSTFDPKELALGIPDEMEEHTTDPEIAKEIVKDHLVTDPKYYENQKTAGEGTSGFDMIGEEELEILRDVENQNSGGIGSDKLNELSNQGLVDYSPGVESTMEPGHWFLTSKGKTMLNKAASRRTAGDWSPLSTFPAGVEVEILENPAYPGAVGTSQVGKRGTVVKSEPNEVEGGEQIVTVDVDGNELKFYESSLKKSASRRTASVMDESRLSAKDNGSDEFYGDDAALRDQLKIREKRKKAMMLQINQLLVQANTHERAGQIAEAKKTDARIGSLYNEWKHEGELIKRTASLIAKRRSIRAASANKPGMFFENHQSSKENFFDTRP